MAYIQPNSTVYLLKGVPCDSDYNHTLWFTTSGQSGAIGRQDQYNTFIQFKHPVHGTYTEQSYQRINKNTIRLGVRADYIYECNYMMFQNTSFGNRWFYAFIREVNYINNNATEIVYELDVMQTWYFDYEMETCFVEREHTATDRIGEHLQPEKVETGDFIVNEKWNVWSAQDLIAVILYVPNYNGYTPGQGWPTQFDTVQPKFLGSTDDGSGWTISPLPTAYTFSTIYNGVYTGVTYNATPISYITQTDYNNSVTRISKLIDKILSIGGTIVDMLHVPADIFYGWYHNGSPVYDPRDRWSTGDMHTMKTTLDGYTPKNNKLLTSPFRDLILTNNSGSKSEYRYEFFNIPGVAVFNVEGVILPTPEITCYPAGYRRVNSDYENGLPYTGLPKGCWSEDSFTKWWQMNSQAYYTSLVGTVVSSAIGVASGGVGLAIGLSEGASAGTIASREFGTAQKAVGGITDIAQSLATIDKHRKTPDQLAGELASSVINICQSRVGFTAYDMSITAEFAKVIDGYFDMYGYAVNEIKVPEVRKSTGVTRAHWNYVKTGNCVIHPTAGNNPFGMSADAEAQITNIYNKGITFWKNPSEVGNYSLDNRASVR